MRHILSVGRYKSKGLKMRQLSNVLVVIAVVIAVYIKWTGDGSEAFFRDYDKYIIGGIALGFLVLKVFRGKK